MIKLEFEIEEINVILNVLNNPCQAQTVVLANIMGSIQNQVSAQVKEEKDGE